MASMLVALLWPYAMLLRKSVLNRLAGWSSQHMWYLGLFLFPYSAVSLLSILGAGLGGQEWIYAIAFFCGLGLLPLLATLIAQLGTAEWLRLTAGVGICVLWSVRLLIGEIGQAGRLHAGFLPTALGVLLLTPLVLGVGTGARLSGPATVVAAVALLLPTNARGPTLAAALGVTVCALLQRRSVLLLAIVVTVLAAILIGQEASITGSVTDYLALDDPYRGLGTGASGRSARWQLGMAHFLANPLLGIGFRNPQARAHSGWVTLLAETGLVGLLPVLALYLGGISGLARRGRTRWVPAALGLIAAVLFMSVWESLTVNLGNPTSLVTLTLLCTGLSATRDQEAPRRIRT